ncbi:MAG: hypothetical protein KDD50_13110 [Bdellovibrionales bacterium]|nr:hypothetical protein [Bdellovibrionales bacterium]
MSFAVKWELRNLSIFVLSIPFSITFGYLFFLWVKVEKFKLFPYFFYRANFNDPRVFNQAYWQYWGEYIQPHLGWLLAAVVIDFMIRKVVFSSSKTA